MAKTSEIALSILIGAKLNNSFKTALGSAKSSLSGFAKIGAASFAAIGAATVAAGKYLYDLGSDFDSVVDSIRIGTGATGSALTALTNDFNSVYSSVPTTMENAGQTIADYNTRLGLSGKSLQDISKQAIQVSDMLGENLGSVIEESSQAFQAWSLNADDMGAAMDYVFKASQSTGVSFTTLMGSVQQFAPQLQELGYGFNESVSLIGQMDKAGVNASEVLAAMKKSVSSLAKEGLSASSGMELYTKKIKNAKSMTEATNIATEIFGTRAASTMAAAIRDGTINVGSLTKELSASSETINGCAEDTYSFAERLQILKNSASVALQPLANTVFDSLGDMMPIAQKALESILPVIEELTPPITDLISLIVDSFGNSLIAIMPSVSSLMQSLIPVIIQVITAVMPVIDKILPLILDLIVQIMPFISRLMPLISQLIPVIVNLISVAMPIITDVISILLPPVMNIITTILPTVIRLIEMLTPILNVLSPIISGMATVLGTELTQAFNMVMPMINAVMDILQGLIDFVSNVFTGNWSAAWDNIVSIFGGIWSGLKAYVKTPINAVIAIVNTAISAINSISIDIPEGVPLVGGKHIGFNISQIPMLASGAVAIAPTLAMIGEGAEPEAVLPLSRLESMLGGIGGGDVFQITYSPIFNIYGDADSAEIEKAADDSFEKFKRYMRQYEKDRRRVAF